MTYLDDLFGLSGQTAIVAGGAGAIGTVMSEALLNAGANVIIWSRSDQSLRQVREKLTGSTDSPERIFTYRVDTGQCDRPRRNLQCAVWPV